MTLNSRRPKPRLLEQELLIHLLLLPVSFPTQPPFWSWDFKNGPLTIRKRRIWWTCILEMYILSKMLLLRFRLKLVLVLLRKSSPPSSRLTSRIIPSIITSIRLTPRLTWLKSKISKFLRRSRDTRNWVSLPKKKRIRSNKTWPSRLKRVKLLRKKRTTKLRISRINWKLSKTT